MSRITELLRRLERQDPALAAELTSEFKTLASRRSFGLNYERHVPEIYDLQHRRVRVGDKVRFIAPRGESFNRLDNRTWSVTEIERRDGARFAHVRELYAIGEPELCVRSVDDLVVVAEFREPIYPGLRSTGKVERGGDKPYHVVINAENYHALEALLFAYEDKVDCIYIDPPYNTRDKDWKYNNDYVDSSDVYRHSKWLAMMERRLKLAKRLLNSASSVLVVTIDEKEVNRLGLLLEQVFEGKRPQLVSIVINPLGQRRDQELARVEEYAFFIFIGSANPCDIADDLLNEPKARRNTARDKRVRWEWLLRGGADATRRNNPDLFYPIFVNPLTRTVVNVGSSLPENVDRGTVNAPDGTVAVWPLRGSGIEGRWRCSPEYFRELLDAGYAKVGDYDQARDQWALLYLGKAQIKRIESGEIQVHGRAADGSVILGPALERSPLVSPKTVWHRAAHRAGEYGTSILRVMIPGRSFPFPKSLYAVEDTLRIATGGHREALILDFFAGSGTTSHAVMRLNRQDGGTRQSIVVTNNEVSDAEARQLRQKGLRLGDPEWEQHGICEYITKPRVEAAITGLTPEGNPINGDYKFVDEFPMSEGFEENAEFFELTYEDPDRVRHDLAFTAIAPLLWMEAGSQGRRIDTPSETFDIADTYAVLFNVDAASGFVKAVAGRDGLRSAYIVTDDERQYQIIADELPRHVEAVRLYEAYLRTFQISAAEE
jgi:adenine-specific DNA-methyltransferase